MPQIAVTIRIDEGVKKKFDALCQDFGMSSNTAFNIFARAVVRNRKIPFEIKSDSREDVAGKAYDALMQMRTISEQNRNAEMNLEEINAEISAAREKRKRI